MEEILIEKVRQHELLYNVKLSDYRDQQARQKEWDDIARDLNMRGKSSVSKL